MQKNNIVATMGVTPATKVRLLAELDSSFNKDIVMRGWMYYAMLFYAQNANKTWGDISAGELLRLYSNKKSYTKAEVLNAGFSVIMNEAIYNDFKEFLPVRIVKCIEVLLWERAVSRTVIEQICNETVFENQRNEWIAPDLKREFTLFNYKIGSGFGYRIVMQDLKVDFFLPWPIKSVIQQYSIKPKSYTLNPIPKPTDENLTFFEAESNIASTLPALITYYRQGQIKYTNNGKPVLAGMKKMLKTLQINEFYKNDQFPTLRCVLMSGIIYGLKSNQVISETHTDLKYLFEGHISILNYAGFLFNCLRGITYLTHGDFVDNAPINILKIYKNLPSNEWISIDNIHEYSKIHDINVNPFTDYDLANKIQCERIINGTPILRPISTGEFDAFIVKPALAGFAFLMAAFGLIDLAYYDKEKKGDFGKDWYSEYDELQAVKLTPLGEYCLGKTNEYTPTNIETACKLVLEPNSLIIRIEGNTALAHVRLSNYTVKVSETRYQFNQGLFLKDCRSIRDVTNKVKMFRQSIGKPLPEYWEEILKKITDNCKLVKKAMDLEVYQLPADNRELHKLIAQDEILKKIIIKAEQYYVLVNTNNVTAFKNRLKEFGILLE